MSRNLARMSPPQLVEEIRQAQADITALARHMGQVAALLHTQARKPDFREVEGRKASIPDGAPREVVERLQRDAGIETSGVYTLYANTWQRFAGMVLQGVRRTTSSDRILRRLEERHPADPRPPAPPVPTPQPAAPSTNDLMELYGIETVTHAQR